jgi:hypothetical protein
MASAFGALGADPSIGHCACLRRELSGEPDAGNLHLRFDEGRVGRATGVAFSPTLPNSLSGPFGMGNMRYPQPTKQEGLNATRTLARLQLDRGNISLDIPFYRTTYMDVGDTEVIHRDV